MAARGAIPARVIFRKRLTKFLKNDEDDNECPLPFSYFLSPDHATWHGIIGA